MLDGASFNPRSIADPLEGSQHYRMGGRSVSARLTKSGRYGDGRCAGSNPATRHSHPNATVARCSTEHVPPIATARSGGASMHKGACSSEAMASRPPHRDTSTKSRSSVRGLIGAQAATMPLVPHHTHRTEGPSRSHTMTASIPSEMTFARAAERAFPAARYGRSGPPRRFSSTTIERIADKGFGPYAALFLDACLLQHLRLPPGCSLERIEAFRQCRRTVDAAVRPATCAGLVQESPSPS